MTDAPQSQEITMEDLDRFIDMMAKFSETTRFIKDHGAAMTEFAPEHADFERGPLGECYSNAGRLAHDRRNLLYVEGYAIPGTVALPMMHAWLVDPKGRIIDPTWADGVAYYGVVIDRAVLAEITMKTGYWGIFDNLWMKPELLDLLKGEEVHYAPR